MLNLKILKARFFSAPLFSVLAGIMSLAMAATISPASAADAFGPVPAAYEESVESYFETRLHQARGAQYRFASSPYKVFTDMRGYEGLACWAVDVRVRSKLPSGSYGGFVPYTVLFLDGEVIAFESDVRRVTRLEAR